MLERMEWVGILPSLVSVIVKAQAHAVVLRIETELRIGLGGL